jgi:hypothetical protein
MVACLVCVCGLEILEIGKTNFFCCLIFGRRHSLTHDDEGEREAKKEKKKNTLLATVKYATLHHSRLQQIALSFAFKFHSNGTQWWEMLDKEKKRKKRRKKLRI